MSFYQVSTTQGSVSVWDSNGSGQPVLFIHSNSSCKETFSHQFKSPLIEEYKFIAIDLPGHGNSDKARDPEKVYSIEGYAEIVMEVVEQLQLEQLVIVGHSFGGHIGLNLLQKTQKIAGLLITGTPPVDFSLEGIDKGFHPLPLSRAILLSKTEFTREEAEEFMRGEGFDTQEDPFVIDAALKADGNARRILAHSLFKGIGGNQKELVETNRTPLCIVQGSDDKKVNNAYIKSLHFTNLFNRIYTIENAGHAAYNEKYREFNLILELFLFCIYNKRVSADSISAAATSEEIQFLCPLTKRPFQDPVLLLEDGFTYERSSIEDYLALNPNKSPKCGQLPSATLRPNRVIKNGYTVCPITQEPFKEAYFCEEDGHTYEKEAILEWFTQKTRAALEEGDRNIVIRSPVAGIGMRSLTLYPNKLLCSGDMTNDAGEPLRFEADHQESASSQVEKCILDLEIRNLITAFLNALKENKTDDELLILKQKIYQRRSELGLSILEENLYDKRVYLDLSHLDLSNMRLHKLAQKCGIFKETNLSGAILEECGFSRCRFINCNMQNTTFIKCDFQGEQTSFSGTDMQNALFGNSCTLEKGDSWQCIHNWSEFKAELISRGAINVDSIELLSTHD